MAWIPCARKAERGSKFCRKHGDAVIGAMLWALVNEEPAEELVHFCEEAGACKGLQATRRAR